MSQPHRVIPILPPSGVEPFTKIQARRISGRFNRWRWAFVALTQLAFYGLPWLSLNGRQALLFDLEARRFYLFSAVLYPQDLIYLTLLLVISALLLFYATTLAGRVWCGFSCPQTVYTELFVWLERRFEGDRAARLRLDAAPWGAPKLLKRGGKHLAWGSLSLWTGLTLVGYFTPIRSLLAAMPAGQLGPWEGFWCLFYGLATYANAGFLREKLCQHMCPYGRFQGSLMDARTLVVAYDQARGEPRAARQRADGQATAGQGACVDCGLCVQVCPVGIDIRQGVQAACISCGLCIDACDRMMDKLRAPRGLVRFSSPQALQAGATATQALWQAVWRPRALIYFSLLAAASAALALGLWQRPDLRLDAMRDRSVLAREVGDGEVENLYRLQVMNASERPRQLRLRVEGPAGLLLASPGTLRLGPAQAEVITVALRLDAAAASRHAGAVLPIRFAVSGDAPGDEATASTDSTFLLPR